MPLAKPLPTYQLSYNCNRHPSKQVFLFEMIRLAIAFTVSSLLISNAFAQVEFISHSEPITLKAAQKEYDTQLELARKAGIPITFEEVARQVKPVPANQNAAPFYKQLSKFKSPSQDDFVPLLKDARDPRKLNQKAAKAFLTKYSEYLTILELGADLPGCDFQRDWTKGYVLIFPEMSTVKYGANLFVLRIHLAAAQKQPKTAAKDLNRIFSMARHIAAEPTTIAKLVAASIQTLATREAVDLAIYYPDQPLYQNLLKTAISSWPERNPAKEFANDFPSLIQLLQNAERKEFITHDLGLPEEEITEPLTVGTPAQQLMAKADIIHYYRRWKLTYSEPPAKYLFNSSSCHTWIYLQMMSFPAVRSVYLGLSPEPVTTRDRYKGINNKLMFTAAQRAIQARDAKGNFPKTIKTDDLIMPFTKSAVQYTSDGKSFTTSIHIPGHELIGGEEDCTYAFPRT
jgi:hypothetical protein